jgi:Bacterial antitoxin of type II TA system, VapB
MPICMRTTLDLDDQLLRKARHLAGESRRTLTAVVEDALRLLVLKPKTGGQKTGTIRLTTFKGQGLHTGVDLDSNASLHDHMDGIR